MRLRLPYSLSPGNPAVPEAAMCSQHFSLEGSGRFSTGIWRQSAHFPEDFQHRSGPPRFMSCQRLSQDELARYDQNLYAAGHVPTISLPLLLTWRWLQLLGSTRVRLGQQHGALLRWVEDNATLVPMSVICH